MAGLLGGHDAGNACNAQHIALFGGAFLDDVQGCGLHDDAAFGHGHAVGGLLGTYVHHMRLAMGVKVGQSVVGEVVFAHL